MASSKPKNISDWVYCGVKLTIHNIIIPEERLSPTPSRVDKMDSEVEVELRIVGCELIQDSGVLLKLPQVAMATAQVLYQRFFYSKSFVRHFYEHYAMACVFLASKLEECPRRIRDIINVFHHIRQVRENKAPTPVMLDQSYTNMKNQVIKAERRVLKELGFCVHAKHPHKLIICYLQALGQESNPSLVQTAWNFMNDSLRTDLFVRYLPEAIACACIHLASCKLGIPLPRHPAWWEMFTVDDESVREIALCLMRLYSRPRPNVAALEVKLAKLRKNLVQNKERESEMRKQSHSNVTPNPTSEHSSGNLTPPNPDGNLIMEPPSTSNDEKINVDDPGHSLNTNSILANALATAKAVAATITATKTTRMNSEVSVINYASEVDVKTSQQPNTEVETKNAQSRNVRHNLTISNLSLEQKRSTEQTTSRRPAAYPQVSLIDDPLDSTISRKRKHDISRQPARLSDSDSAYGDADVPSVGPPTAYSLPNNSRQYRQHCRDGASSSNSSASVSPSPIPKKYSDVLHVISKKSAPGTHRSSSSQSSSSHSDNHSSHRHRSNTDSRRHKKSKGGERNGPLPPKAYRTENRSSQEQLSVKLHRSTNGDKSRSTRSRHHRHRHRESKDTDDKRHVASREHRRR